MKTDERSFDSKKTIQEIVDILNKVKCKKENIEGDPFGDKDGHVSYVTAVLSGKASALDAFKHLGAGKSEWGVLISVYDLGDRRHIRMAALGESQIGAAFRAYGPTGGKLSRGYGQLSNQYYNIRHSKDHRDRIAEMLL